MIIFHPFRQNGINDDDDLPEDYTPTQSNDGNKHNARFAPHFHVLGFGWVKPSSEDFVNSHKGWIYKAVRTGRRRIKSLPEVVGVVNYLMSHVGLISEDSPVKMGRKQAVNWIGLCNSRGLVKIGDIRIYVQRLCEICGADMVIHAVRGPRNNEIEFQGKSYTFQEFPIYSDSEHKGDLIEFCEENKGDPVGLLRHIEQNPELGVCYLTSRELDRRISTPTPIYAKKDGSVHIPDVYATFKERRHRKRVKIRRPPSSGSNGGLRFVARPEYNPEEFPGEVPYIDFTLPPEADLV